MNPMKAGRHLPFRPTAPAPLGCRLGSLKMYGVPQVLNLPVNQR